MNRVGISSFLGILAAGFLLGTAAWALERNPECVAEARNAKKQCLATCIDQFQLTKDACVKVEHDCADACRAGRRACFDQPLSDLQACVGGCNATLDTAKTDCRAQFEEGTPERDQCIDAAQVVAFQCRDTCRESLDRATLKACRKAFRLCIRACPPTN